MVSPGKQSVSTGKRHKFGVRCPVRVAARKLGIPVILALQRSVQAGSFVLAGLCVSGQAGPEVAQQLIAGQGHTAALLLQWLGQIGQGSHPH